MPRQMQAFGYRTAVKREKNQQFEQELRDYNSKLSVMRAQHRKEYWEIQTQVENNYLATWQKEQRERQLRDLDRWRTSICKIAMSTKKHIDDLEAREKKTLERMRVQDIKNTKKQIENKMMLDAMQLESKKWPTLFDLNQKIDENVILPQTILNYGEYQQKLQNLAFYAEQGDHESMQKLLDKEEIMERKNMFLQPIYRDLKSIIKHMTHTEEYRLFKEYTDNRNAILAQFPGDSDKAQQGLKMLEQEYAKLLRNHKKSLQDPTKRLKVMQQRLEDIFQLLNLWTQYVEVIYMPETEIHILSTIQKMDARPEETSFGFRAQEEDIKRRINTLFGKDNAPIAKKTANKEDAYETVNEGMTTDTTEAPQHQAKRPTLDQHEPEDKAQEEEEGILSSDEEQTLPKNEKQPKLMKVKDKPINTEEVRDFGETKVFSDDKGKEEVENRFNYNENDIERFGAKLQTKAEKEKVRSIDHDEDRQFVKKSTYQQEDFEKMDMHNLNLFGIPLEEVNAAETNIGSSSETKQILKDLIDMTEQMDESINNFALRKSFVYYDPYDPEQSVTYAYLKFEDQQKLRASIVLDYYKKELDKLKDEDISYADKERKQQVANLLEYLGQLKIVDAQILLKIYELYRYKV